MKCFYHSADLDGKLSGFLVKHVYPFAEMRPIDYGEEFPWEVLADDVVVFMVDFSLPHEEMLKLKSEANLVWIDHHRTALEWDSEEIMGLRRAGVGACELTWEYLMKSAPPLAVKLISDYDVWNLQDRRVLSFQYGCRVHQTDPATVEGRNFWISVLWDEHHQPIYSDRFLRRILLEGEVCLDYEKIRNEDLCRRYSFSVMFEGYRGIALNEAKAGSRTFESVYGPYYDLMISFAFDGKSWTVLLRTDRDIDVSEIAKKYGGGGHKQAAGFVAENILFEKKGENIILHVN